jgi:hypothetical protein
MRRLAEVAILASIVVLVADGLASAQRRSAPVRKPPAPVVAPKTMAPDITCPSPLGVGVATQQQFCDVMAGRDPAEGVIVKLPPHKGPVTLTFDLHNRHTYSEEQTRANKAYARYTATVGVFAMDNTLISRAVVQSEFRKIGDLVDRIGGGAGPGGVKAVAPTGTEPITVTIPEAEGAVSIVGEKLTVDRIDGTATYNSAGRPIAVINNVMIEYRPGPPSKLVKKGR